MHVTHFLVGLAGLTLSIAAPTPGDAGALQLGRIKVCDGFGQQGTCKDINANMACAALESPIKYNLKSVIQDKGSICAYHHGSGCDNFAFLVDSSHDTQTADVALTWYPVLTHIICIPSSPGLKPSSLTVSLGAKLEDLAPVLASASKPNLITRQNTAGDALVCSPDTPTGPCFKVPASGSCTDLPANVDRRVRTIYQNQGSYCEFFKSDDCRGRLGWSDSALRSVRIAVPDAFGNAMGSVSCKLLASVAGSAGVEEMGWEEGEFVAEEVF